MLLLFTAGCGGGAGSTDATASQKGGAEEQAIKGLLPADDVVEGWLKKGKFSIFRGDDLFEHINGGADIYFEYGFVTLVVQQYAKDDKNVTVEVYHMGDPSEAFGIYSYNRHPTLSPVEVGGDGTIHPNGILFWQDRYYVDIRRFGAGAILESDFLALAKSIEKSIGATAETPALVKLLPEQNMVARSAVFARGRLGISNQVYVAPDDLFGLKDGEAAAIARYRIGQPEFSVIVADYKDDAARSAAFGRLRAHFLGAESAREGEFVVMPMQGKHHAVREAGNRLLVVANADSEKHAVGMLDRISDHIKAE